MPADYSNYAELRPGLCVGGEPVAAQAVAGRFEAVLDLRPTPECGLAEDYAALGIGYRHYPLRDGQVPVGGLDALAPLMAWIGAQRAADRRVLIHCQGGSSRAPFIAACYLLQTEGGAPDAVLRDVLARRPQAALMALAFRQTLRQASQR